VYVDVFEYVIIFRQFTVFDHRTYANLSEISLTNRNRKFRLMNKSNLFLLSRAIFRRPGGELDGGNVFENGSVVKGARTNTYICMYVAYARSG